MPLIDEKIQALSVVKKIADRMTESHIAAYRHQRNQLTAHIHQLPFELFERVIGDSLNGYPERWDVRRLNQLRLVSLHFARTIDAASRLWAILDVDFAYSVIRARQLLQKSGSAPLTIVIGGWRDARPMMGLASAHIHRWKNLHIERDLDKTMPFLMPHAPMPETDRLDPDAPSTAFHLESGAHFSGQAPRLRTLKAFPPVLYNSWAGGLGRVENLRLWGSCLGGLDSSEKLMDVLIAVSASIIDLDLDLSMDSAPNWGRLRVTTYPRLLRFRMKSRWRHILSLLENMDAPECRLYELAEGDFPPSHTDPDIISQILARLPLQVTPTAMEIGPAELRLLSGNETTVNIQVTDPMLIIQAISGSVQALAKVTTFRLHPHHPCVVEMVLSRLDKPDGGHRWALPNLRKIWVRATPAFRPHLKKFVAGRHGLDGAGCGGLPARLEEVWAPERDGGSQVDVLPALELELFLGELVSNIPDTVFPETGAALLSNKEPALKRPSFFGLGRWRKPNP